MDGGQRTRHGAFLSLGSARAVGAFWTGKNAARGEYEDVAIGEFLFEFAG